MKKAIALMFLLAFRGEGQVIDVNGHRGTERMLQRLFSDYGVFDIETDERIKSLEQDGNTDLRPAKTP